MRVKIKVKGNGQECPFHAGSSLRSADGRGGRLSISCGASRQTAGSSCLAGLAEGQIPIVRVPRLERSFVPLEKTRDFGMTPQSRFDEDSGCHGRLVPS
jgi:hypothetical protein